MILVFTDRDAMHAETLGSRALLQYSGSTAPQQKFQVSPNLRFFFLSWGGSRTHPATASTAHNAPLVASRDLSPTKHALVPT